MKTLTAVAALSPFVFGSHPSHRAWAGGGAGYRTVAAISLKLLPLAKACALDRLLQQS
jgi:hypothetical protein